jgi:hypothetical protein
VRADIAAVARRTRDLLPEDTTGKHELVAIEARQRSSPPPPPPRRIPPPPRKPRV